MRYTYAMAYYFAIKRGKNRPFGEMWMDPESVIQTEVSLKEKNKYCIQYRILYNAYMLTIERWCR